MVVSKFAPAGSWVAMATIRPADSTLFQGHSVEDYTCVLRVPGRVIATNRARYYVDDNDR
jgi:hypothetical protein